MTRFVISLSSTGKSGFRKFGADVLGDDGVARGLGEDAAEHRPPSADAIDEDVQSVQHAIDVERRGLDRNQNEIGDAEAAERRLRAKARRVDDDGVVFADQTLRRL